MNKLESQYIFMNREGIAGISLIDGLSSQIKSSLNPRRKSCTFSNHLRVCSLVKNDLHKWFLAKISKATENIATH